MPIINSLLDLDFYKLTMGQLAFKLHCDVQVKYAFNNRTSDVNLLDFITVQDLIDELGHVRTLKFKDSEIKYLRGIDDYGDRLFYEDYLQFLKKLRLPRFNIKVNNGELFLEFEGKWSETIYWETIALAIINELYYRALLKNMSAFDTANVYATGITRLKEKIEKIKQSDWITFTEFGTRRRFSRDWQDYVVETLAAELPKNLTGTSNAYLAMKYNLRPIGTFAHELDMAYSGIYHKSDKEIRRSHSFVLKDWWDMYSQPLSIALTDTYGTDFFFQDMTKEQAEKWQALRQDSGDPFEFGCKAIDFYQAHGIDPKKKLIVFSDGLDVDKIIDLANSFWNKINTTFGWGTNLTNDLGLKPLSLVIKLVEANGHCTVKLSDNLAKAMGSLADIERFKKIFGHTVTFKEKCKY